jgi:hypothetical protein
MRQDVLRLRHRLRDRLGQLARLAAGRLGQQHRDVAGVVAVLTVLAALDDEVGLVLEGQRAGPLHIEQGLQDEFAQMVFHVGHAGRGADRAL